MTDSWDPSGSVGDAIDDSAVDDPAPDEPLGSEEYGTTVAEQRHPESVADRVRREEPDVVRADDDLPPGLVEVDPLDQPGDDGMLTGEAAGEFRDPTTRDYPTEREAPIPAEVDALHVEEL